MFSTKVSRLTGHFMREKRIWPYDFGLYVKREEALQKLKVPTYLC